MNRLLFSFFVILVIRTACATPVPTGPQIHVENAWARPTIGSSMGAGNPTQVMQGMPGISGMADSGMASAAYFVIVNDGAQADTLIGASSDVAKGTDLHETRIKDNIAEMVPVARLDIPAGGRIEFNPDGYHVMLNGLTRDLKIGDTIKLTLQFEKSGAIAFDVPIRMEK